MRYRPKKHTVEQVSAALGRVIRRYGLERGIREQQAIAVWPEVVGPALARVTEPLFLNQGRLVVRVDGSSWHAELHHLLPQLLGQLNKQLDTPVAEIKLRAGRVQRESKPVARLVQVKEVPQHSVETCVQRAQAAAQRQKKPFDTP